MIPLKGTWKDSPLSNHPDGFAYEVINGVINKNLASITNESGTSEFSSQYNALGYQQLGIFNAKGGDKLVFSKKGVLDKIGIIKSNGTYVEKLSTNLGFNIDYPIDCELYYNYKGEIIAAFTDYLNTPKIINLDNIVLPFNIKDIELNSIFTQPQVISDIEESGGSLKTGAYFPFFGYKNDEGSSSPYTAIENPIYITNSVASQGFNNYEGAKADTPSNKLIKMQLSNVDENYDKIVVGFISKIDGILKSIIVKELPITGSTMTISYGGSEIISDINIEEVLVSSVIYDRIKHFTQVNGVLYGAVVSEASPIAFQKYANLITLKYTSEIINPLVLESSYKVNEQNNKKKSFKHEEVYALFIRLKIKGRGFSEAFHIPGRVAEGNEKTLFKFLGGDNSVQISIAPNSKVYQINDTTGSNGKLGYWENEDEFYPNTLDYAPINGSEDLRGKNIRHHRFPSINKLKTELYSGVTTYGYKVLDILGLEVTSFPTLPQELLDIIEGYEIYYAKRTSNNSLVNAQSIINMWSRRDNDTTPDDDSDTRLFWTGGNYQLDVKKSNSGGQRRDFTIQSKEIRFNSFDLLLDKPAITPNYLSTQIGIRAGNIAANHTIAFSNGEGTRTYAYDINYAQGESNEIAVSSADKYKKITNFKYIPAHSNPDNYVNIAGEECASATIVGNPYSNMDYQLIYTSLWSGGSNSMNFETTYLVNLMSYKTNCYNSINSQLLVSTGKYIKIGDNDKKIYGGDIFIGLHSFVSIGLDDYRAYEDGPGAFLNRPGGSIKNLRTYLTEGYNNMSLRHTDSADEGTKYYPKEVIGGNVAWFLGMNVGATFNKIAYNKDYSSVNDLNSFTIFDVNNKFIAEDPYKIVRTKVPNKEERQPSWKVFLANDYYIIPRDKGYITNIQGVGNDLFINCEQALLKTRGSEELATDSFKVVLGTGNIFDRPPIEMVFEETGYAGCQHKFSCLLTRYGYFFIDEDRKKVFLVADTVKDITEGLKNFFRDNLKTTGDNPYRENGYTVGWDEEYERIILSSKEAGFTRSYYPSLNSWYGRSFYYPNMMIGDRNSLFAFSEGKIYKHNNPLNKGIYYASPVIHSFAVVIVIKDNKNQIALTNVNWKTLFTLDGNPIKNKTFDKLLAWNSYQSTGDVTLIPHDSDQTLVYNYDETNIRRVKNIWNFNKTKNKIKVKDTKFIDDIDIISGTIGTDLPFYMKKLLMDDYIAIKLLFSNKKFGTLQGEIQFLDFDVNGNIITR